LCKLKHWNVKQLFATTLYPNLLFETLSIVSAMVIRILRLFKWKNTSLRLITTFLRQVMKRKIQTRNLTNRNICEKRHASIGWNSNISRGIAYKYLSAVLSKTVRYVHWLTPTYFQHCYLTLSPIDCIAECMAMGRKNRRNAKPFWKFHSFF
jgi:hypothetical protein